MKYMGDMSHKVSGNLSWPKTGTESGLKSTDLEKKKKDDWPFGTSWAQNLGLALGTALHSHMLGQVPFSEARCKN